MESLEGLGRDELVRMAVEEIRRSGDWEGFDPAAFDRISARADAESLWVTFAMSVRFVPRAGAHAYGVTVFLRGGGGVRAEILPEPEQSSVRMPFRQFRHTDCTRGLERTVLDRIGLVLPLDRSVQVTIAELESGFRVSIIGKHDASFSTIDSVTWAVSDRVEETLVPPPDEESDVEVLFE